MVKTSAWGTRRFQKGNAEDEAVKQAIYQKLFDLGEDPNDKNSQLKPEEIHKMDKSWQPYSADSFGKVVRALRKIIYDGGDRDALDDEEDVIPPSKDHRATGRQTSSLFVQGYGEVDDDEEEAADEDDANQLQYGSNGGTVQLPYVFVKVTHPPEGDETGRTKKLHLIVQLLSGTHAKMGYSVSCPPKGHHIIITHQKGLENIFWGHTGRAMVPAGVAQDQMTLACATMTTNFTNIPKQEQVITFPFTLDRILKKKPFFVNTGNGPGQQFLGLYICAKVDWTDVEAEGAGDDYVELLSPNAKNMGSGNPFYAGSAQSCSNMRGDTQHDKEFQFAPNSIGGGMKFDVAGGHHGAQTRSALAGETACGDGDSLTGLEERLLIKLSKMMAKNNIGGGNNETGGGGDQSQNVATRGGQKHIDVSIANRFTAAASASTTSVKTAPVVMQDTGVRRGRVLSNTTGGLRLTSKKLSPYEVTATTAAGGTNIDDVSGVSFDDEIEDVEEVYNCDHSFP